MTRTELINNIIAENNYKSYLEIGVQHGENYKGVKCKYKVGVDPDADKYNIDNVLKCTSDYFFKIESERYKKEYYDCIFIDGLHHVIQNYKDITNALKILNEGGTIICHDMNPTTEILQHVPRLQPQWNGDCWMAWVWLRATREDLNMYVIDTDYGCGIIQRGSQKLLNIDCNITFENFLKNKTQWLNLVPAEKIKPRLEKQGV